jgi:hypothetical protein
MNKRGVALILSYAVIMVLTILASVFLSSVISENNLVRRYQASSQAFWIAEAGLANAYHSWSLNRAYTGEANIPLGEGTYTVTKIPVNPQVTVTGTVGTTQRTIHAQFVGIPRAFDNVLSAGGGIYPYIHNPSTPASMTVRGNIRYSKEYRLYYEDSLLPSFSSPPQQADQSLTTIRIPDYNGNKTADEFDDFVQFGRQVIAAYPPEQTVWIKTDDIVWIGSYSNLQGKKVVFVEGSRAPDPWLGGRPGVVYLAPDLSALTQDLTIITTGGVQYHPYSVEGTPPQGSRLNTISWGDSYIGGASGSSSLASTSGVYYSHSYIDSMNWDSSFTYTGNFISNGNMTFWEYIPSLFQYSDRAAKGDLPPGFEFLSDNSNGTPKLIKWSEE